MTTAFDYNMPKVNNQNMQFLLISRGFYKNGFSSSKITATNAVISEVFEPASQRRYDTTPQIEAQKQICALPKQLGNTALNRGKLKSLENHVKNRQN